MLKINMFSTATKVKGQGVASAYSELINMLKRYFPEEFDIKINDYSQSDISHYHTINPTFFVSTFFKKRGRKIGYVHFLPETLEGSLKIPKLVKGLVYRYVIAFYKRMDHIVVVNPSFIPKLEKYGIDRQTITYIPNFVNRDEFHPANRDVKRSLRKKRGYDPDRFTVLGSGQIQTRKGVLDFVTLAKQNPTLQFIWTGGFSFGKMTEGYAELERIVKDPPSNLSFPGIIDRAKMVEYYNMADLFILPSYNELFPMSVLEAFSTQTPVMLRDLDLYKSIIDGDYLAAANVEEMNQKLALLVHHPDELAKLTRKAEEASERYSESRLAKIWYDFYNQQARKG